MKKLNVLQWLTSYLSGRQQRDVVDGATPNVSPVLSGIPQGLFLGPMLFLAYINCVSLVPLSEGSRISVYADNILLSKPINHPDNYDDLQRDIDTIQECISTCHLTLNPSKCKYLIASRRGNLIYYLLDYSLAGMFWNRLTATVTWVFW